MPKPDALAITIIFIIVTTFIAAFVGGRHRDKCLKDFANYIITLQDVSGKCIWGRLRIETTGLELTYAEKHADAEGHVEATFILYKNEFGNMRALVRFHDDLTEKGREQRQKDLKRTYHPGMLRRLRRKTVNVFKTIRDSVMEVVNLLLSQAKKRSVAGGVLGAQDKYVSQIKQEIIGAAGTSYEPLLERHIGHVVVLEMIKDDAIVEYPGVLKDYTAEFIEIMDVQYRCDDSQPVRKADLVVPRRCGVVRHLGE
jgi:hypothetical protein